MHKLKMNVVTVKSPLSSWRYAVSIFSVNAKTSYTLAIHRIADRTNLLSVP